MEAERQAVHVRDRRQGFKGGGFDDTPANVAQSIMPFDPETVTNYEIGFKANLLDRRIRLNADIFLMDYKNLQVTQTNAACLCNLTDNAASADIKGVEAEFEFAATDNLRLSLSGSYVDATYKDFLESAVIPGTTAASRQLGQPPAAHAGDAGQRRRRLDHGRGPARRRAHVQPQLQLAGRHALGDGQHREGRLLRPARCPHRAGAARIRRGRSRSTART